MSTLSTLHGYWAYLTLAMLLIASINALAGFYGNKEFKMAKDLRISLFALIFTHIQLVLGILVYVTGFSQWSKGNIMGDDFLRLILIEHPTINIIAIALITIGWSKHKKQATSKHKFGKIALFYTIGLVLILLRIPYDIWLK
ncbi:hypothetical protein ACG2LH_01690 [Zhouia sp. PK063]|uniref:hypothetical protein n=1 Tax=Zhouia sp. PK063 TaxID=3373602 RepID=UPI0037A854AC